MISDYRNKTIKEIYTNIKTQPSLYNQEFSEINKVYNSEKCKELDFWNKIYHTNVVSANLGFLKGRIYIFDYIYPNIQDKKFIDTRPLVFVLDEYTDEKTKSQKIKGLNLNYLPIEGKVNFLDVYYRLFKNILIKDIDLTNKNFYSFYIYKDKDMEYLKSVCSKYLRSIGYSTRTWDKSRINIKTSKVVRFQDYFSIYLYEGYKNTIKGQDIRLIYSNYYKKEK